MHSSYCTLFLALSLLNVMQLVRAGLFVVTPYQGSECRASQPCTVTWLEDGRSPLLNTIGVSTVGLYTGNQQLIQTLQPVNVNNQHSLTFTPNPAAGPDSDNYYIAFISTTYKINGTAPYVGYSPYFRLTGMSGSFNSPYPPATSSIPIPSSLANPPRSTSTSTITVGTPYSTPTPATPSTSPVSSSSSPSSPTFSPSMSGFITSTLPSSSTAKTSPTSTTLSSGTTGTTSLPLSALSFFLPIILVSSSLVLLS